MATSRALKVKNVCFLTYFHIFKATKIVTIKPPHIELASRILRKNEKCLLFLRLLTDFVEIWSVERTGYFHFLFSKKIFLASGLDGGLRKVKNELQPIASEIGSNDSS